jgi:hypothetical protein
VVMKRLHRLMRVWSAEQSHQVRPASPVGSLWGFMHADPPSEKSVRVFVSPSFHPAACTAPAYAG